MNKIHYLDKYLTDPTHDITINLIGCGGTGSRILSGLASINVALRALEKVGISVTVYDPERISETNIGRQLYSPSDIGLFKSDVIVSRINRFYGFDWRSVIEKYGMDYSKKYLFMANSKANITIMAVDTLKSRLNIDKLLRLKGEAPNEERKPIYIIDTGNSRYSGQVMLYTPFEIEQPDMSKESEIEAISFIESPFKQYPEMFKDIDNTSEPSCSMPEALIKQDLFVNILVADHAMNLLWGLLNNAFTISSGVFINSKLNSTRLIRLGNE